MVCRLRLGLVNEPKPTAAWAPLQGRNFATHAAGNREKDLKAQIDRLQTQVSEADEQINALTAERDELRKKVDDTTALAATAMPADAARANSLRRHSPPPASARSDALPPRLAPPLGR
jgi:phage shock protein A